MKKVIFIGFALCVALFSSSVSAKEDEWVVEPKNVRNAVSESADVLFGGIIMLATHEWVGHQFVANGENIELHWRGGDSAWANSENKSSNRMLALGGFGSQFSAKEMIFQSGIKNPIGLGAIGFVVLNEIACVYRYEKGEENDITVYEKNGGNVKILEVALLADAIYSACRVAGWCPNDPLVNVRVVTDRSDEGTMSFAGTAIVLTKDFRF